MKTLRHLIATAAAVLGTAVIQAEEITLFAWSEYVPQNVIDQFTKETGIKVNYETYASNEEMLAKLLSASSSYDLIQPSEYAIEALVRHGKLEEIDWKNVPNRKNIAPEYLGLPHDPEQKYSIPYMVGSVGIVTNTERIKEPITSFKEVFSGKHAGRIVALNDYRELVSWALASAGKEMNEINAASIEVARPILANWIPQVKVFDSDSPKTAIRNGDVDVGIVWSGEGAILFAENPKYQYVLPTEGAHMFIDSLAIPKGAPNKTGAEKFINFILRPDISKLVSDEYPYTNPNLEARKLLTPEQLANPASYPGKSKMDTFRDIGKGAALIDRLVTDLKGGGS